MTDGLLIVLTVLGFFAGFGIAAAIDMLFLR